MTIHKKLYVIHKDLGKRRLIKKHIAQRNYFSQQSSFPNFNCRGRPQRKIYTFEFARLLIWLKLSLHAGGLCYSFSFKILWITRLPSTSVFLLSLRLSWLKVNAGAHTHKAQSDLNAYSAAVPICCWEYQRYLRRLVRSTILMVLHVCLASWFLACARAIIQHYQNLALTN